MTGISFSYKKLKILAVLALVFNVSLSTAYMFNNGKYSIRFAHFHKYSDGDIDPGFSPDDPPYKYYSQGFPFRYGEYLAYPQKTPDGNIIESRYKSEYFGHHHTLDMAKLAANYALFVFFSEAIAITILKVRHSAHTRY